MFFKDVITEIVEALMKVLGKIFKKKSHPMLCQWCKKSLIKKQNVGVHYAEVASFKFVLGAISSLVAEATSCVPAPDYNFICPKCGAIHVRATIDIGKPFILVTPGIKQKD